MTAFPLEQPIYYPESDGQPMAESDLHRDEMVYFIDALKDHYRDDPLVYVAGNLFLYYEKGRPRSVVAPDVFVVRGVAKRQRRVYKLWEEGVPPCLIVEVTSESTRDEDLVTKRDRYAQLGVEEYFLYDPTADYLPSRLEGLRLVKGRYRKIQLEPDGSLLSRTTGVRLVLEGPLVRLVDAAIGKRLLRSEEKDAALRAAEARIEEEAAARRVLEEELERPRRQLRPV
jgi:Uma2 family endonuclease